MKFPDIRNWKFIKGRTRVVFLTNRFAFKVPNFFNWKMFLLGLQQSMFERENTMASQFLMPLLFSLPGGWLNVMPRAKDVFTEDQHPDLLNYFKAVYVSAKSNELEGVTTLDIIEVAEPANFGWYKGHVVCIDYGCGKNAGLNEFVIQESIKKFNATGNDPHLIIERFAGFWAGIILPEYRYNPLMRMNPIRYQSAIRLLLVDSEVHSYRGPTPMDVHAKLSKMMIAMGTIDSGKILDYLKSDTCLAYVESKQRYHEQCLVWE